MTDQLQDIEQEMMFKRNEQRYDRRAIVLAFIVTGMSVCAGFYESIESGLFTYLTGLVLASVYLIRLQKKYPFRKEHLKQ